MRQLDIKHYYVTNKPKKKDNDMMKQDMTTHKDRELRQIGMTTDHTCQPDKVLFFADPHFFLSKPTHIAHIGKPHEPSLKPMHTKECNINALFLNGILS